MFFSKKSIVNPESALPLYSVYSLLEAVVEADLSKARMIVQSNPELALDKSEHIVDFSGKSFKCLSPFQVAACVRDVDILNMMVDTFRRVLRNGGCFNFNAQQKMQQQFEEVYPRGDISAAEIVQQASASQLFDSTLPSIRDAIKTAAMDEVLAELNNPASKNSESVLSKVLRNFRQQFAERSNMAIAFNPFYLENAYKFYYNEYYNFSESQDPKESWTRGILFWRQVIGYMQRHMPIVYLQAFATSLFLITRENKSIDRAGFDVTRGFFNDEQKLIGELDNLGYTFAHSTVGTGDASVLWHAKCAWEDVATWNGRVREGLERVYDDVSSSNLRARSNSSLCCIM